jgi:hypothetical protein
VPEDKLKAMGEDTAYSGGRHGRNGSNTIETLEPHLEPIVSRSFPLHILHIVDSSSLLSYHAAKSISILL